MRTVEPVDRPDPAVWDVVVVGAGPAGSAAALAALRRDPAARILLLDRSTFPRDKACGDGIAPEALDVLAALGAPDVVAGFAPVPSFRLTTAGGAQVARRMRRPTHVVPRSVFDARLLAAATGRGAQLVEHRVRRIDVRPDLIVLDGEIAARAVIGADGAHSAVRRELGVPPARAGTVALALRGYARTPPGGDGEQAIRLARGRWPAYAWTFPIGDGWSNVGYGELLTHAPVTREQLLERLAALLPTGLEDLRDLRAHRLPLSTGRPRLRDGRVLLAGDAQSLINPFTGEGIHYAVLSGALSGAAALDGPGAGATYRRALRRELGTHLRHTGAVAMLTRGPGLVDGAVRAAARRQGVFDDLVELGLGRGRLHPGTLARVVSSVPASRRPVNRSM
jgi:geranylgeranyl reductase family protein